MDKALKFSHINYIYVFQSVLYTLKTLFPFFCFLSCKKSQIVNHYHGCKSLCFVLSHITSRNNIAAVQIKEAVGNGV